MFLTNGLKVDYEKYYEKPTMAYKHYGLGMIQLDPQKFSIKNIRVALNEAIT